VLIKNIDASPSLRTDVSRAEGFKSAVCVPIKNQGKLVAVAAGFSREQRSLAKSQRDIIRPLGELAGVAIHNAGIYRQKHKMAAIFQEKLTPSVVPHVVGLDIGHKFLPARGVGGDYYDFINSTPNRLGVIVADVAGSDIEAAEYTTMGKHVLRAYAREYPSPAEVLSKTNQVICEDSRTEMFISLFYGVLDLEQGKLRYASAGCEPPLLYKAKTKTIVTLNAEGMLLGIKPNAAYCEQEIAIEPGDILLAHTDGLTEASAGNSRFGGAAVQSVLVKSAIEDAQTVVDHLYDALMEFGHGKVSDDVAIVAVKVL
jgi:sigma-B regulation protein RsbU (phosphoserine phosphatase)